MRLAHRLLLATLVASATRGSAQTVVSITGTVHDSLHGVQLARAGVIATPIDLQRDTAFHSVLADDRGRFSFVGLRPGRYALTVEHAMLDSTGISISNIPVDVTTAGPATITLATPSSVSLRRALCPAAVSDTTVGVVVGVVRHTDGTPVPGAAVVFTWNDFDVNSSAASVTSHRVTESSRSDANGVYRNCNVPISRPIYVQAQGEMREQSGILQETIGLAGVLVRDFRIAVDPAAAITALDSASAGSGMLLVGIVTDVRDRPITSAQVVLAGTSRVATTNDRGEFRFAGAPGGTRSVEVTALGYYPRSLVIEVDPGAPPLRVRMERTAVILDSLQVIAKRTTRIRNLRHEEFETRLGHGIGTFFTRAGIDSIHPQTLLDVFRHTPAVKLAAPHNAWDMLIVSNRGPVEFGATVCPLDIYLDGVHVKQEDVRGIPPEMVYGMEIHTVATAPPRYKIGNCGALFIWTR
jgi:hypothetical protein